MAQPQYNPASRRWTTGAARRFEISTLERRILLAGHPLDCVPALSSNPASAVKLYLDFSGDPEADWYGVTVPQTPAYDQDGDATSFIDSELANITQIWKRVSEKFSPFDVDVTTIPPGTLNHREALKVIIGGRGEWYGVNATGVAWVGSFYTMRFPNSVYAFSATLGGNPKQVAEVIAHESGHAFGLNHQSRYAGGYAEYNPGTSLSAPIMGNSYTSDRGLWWIGPTFSPTSIQDDLLYLSDSTNGFGYRPDDHGNSPATADPLSTSGSAISGAGIIEKTVDVDCFRFTSGPGMVSLSVNVAPFGPMLHARAELRDSGGNLLAAADAASLGQSLSATVAGGTYYLLIGSHGDYGDIGQYTLSGTLPSAVLESSAAGNGYYLTRAGQTIEVFAGGEPSGTPVYTMPASSSLGLVFAGRGGDDSLTVDCSGGQSVPAGGVYFYGDGGSNSLRIIGGVAMPALTLGQNQLLFADGKLIDFDNIGELQLDAADNSALAMTAVVDLGKLVFASGRTTLAANQPQSELNMEVRALAGLTLTGVVQVDGLTVNDRASLDMEAGGDAILKVKNLTINGSGALDVADNNLIIQSDAASKAGIIAAFTPILRSGRNGGEWNGAGIISSTAAADANHTTGLAMVINDDGSGGVLISKIGPLDVAGDCILIRSVGNGDSNLDGVVNGDDYFRIDRGFQKQASGYANGDFDYSGTVGPDDYFLIDSAIMSQSLSTHPATSQTAARQPKAAQQTARPQQTGLSASLATHRSISPKGISGSRHRGIARMREPIFSSFLLMPQQTPTPFDRFTCISKRFDQLETEPALQDIFC